MHVTKYPTSSHVILNLFTTDHVRLRYFYVKLTSSYINPSYSNLIWHDFSLIGARIGANQNSPNTECGNGFGSHPFQLAAQEPFLPPPSSYHNLNACGVLIYLLILCLELYEMTRFVYLVFPKTSLSVGVLTVLYQGALSGPCSVDAAGEHFSLSFTVLGDLTLKNTMQNHILI